MKLQALAEKLARIFEPHGKGRQAALTSCDVATMVEALYRNHIAALWDARPNTRIIPLVRAKDITGQTLFQFLISNRSTICLFPAFSVN